jgi:hypothetical protein
MGITTLRRRDYMRAVLESAKDTGDAAAPWTGVGDVSHHFDDEADLVVELHREWLRLLVARLHRGEIVAQRTAADVRDLYDQTCEDNPTLRRILDAHTANPVLWEPTAREHAMLARIAGLAGEDTAGEDAASLGRSLLASRGLPAQRPALSG